MDAAGPAGALCFPEMQAQPAAAQSAAESRPLHVTSIWSHKTAHSKSLGAARRVGHLENYIHSRASGCGNVLGGLKHWPPSLSGHPSPQASVSEENVHALSPHSLVHSFTFTSLLVPQRTRGRETSSSTRIRNIPGSWRPSLDQPSEGVTPQVGPTLGQRGFSFQSPIKCCWQAVRFSFERNQTFCSPGDRPCQGVTASGK